MEKPFRILYVNGGLMHRGGIESFMMNYYRHFDRSLIQIDFIVHGYGEGAYDKEIENLGGKIYHVPIKSKHPFRYAGELRKIFKKGNYTLVHSHVDAMSCWILKTAKECGIPIRIAHSHNTDHLTKNPLKYALNEFARKNITKYATHCFACSRKAGEWLFGEREFTVVNNAIDLTKFTFNLQVRNDLRGAYNISENDFVIGHVGRFDEQKNHSFLLDVFAAYAKENASAKLVLIGDGNLRREIEEKISFYSIENKVFLLGTRADVNDCYNMMDVFVLPSKFEGLGIVAIEAQTNGLYCLLSENVPRQAAILSDQVEFLSEEVQKWVDALKKSVQFKRTDKLNLIRKAGYDIIKESEKLQEFYLSLQEQLG